MLIKGVKLEKQTKIKCLLYGDPRVGKTYTYLEMLSKTGDKAIVFCFDGGLLRQHIDSFDLGERLLISSPKSYQELISDIDEAEKVLAKGNTPKDRVWIIFDTITHLQAGLLTEAREKQIETNRNQDMMWKIMNTQLDYGVNLAIITAINKKILEIGTNVLYIALSRQDEMGNISPAIVGQSNVRVSGDMDIIGYMKKSVNMETGLEERKIVISGGNYICGDRFGVLSQSEKSLADIVKKVRGGVETKQEEAPQPKAETQMQVPTITSNQVEPVKKIKK